MNINLNREERKKLHKYRLANGNTTIGDFSTWNVAWKMTSDEQRQNAWTEYCVAKNKNIDLDCPKEVLDYPKEAIAHTDGYWHCYPDGSIGWIKKQEETETNMYAKCCAPSNPQVAHASITVDTTSSAQTAEQQAKDYLIASLNQEMFLKREREADAFNLRDRGPRTFGELRAAIKNGWVTIPKSYDKEEDDQPLYDSAVYMLQIRDPEKEPDEKGYSEAMKQMAIDASAVKDQIIVMGPEKGLDALNEFKTKTYH